MDMGRLPAWCERRHESNTNGHYVVACYFTRDGHPVTRARAEKVLLTEYHPDGTPLIQREATVEDGNRSQQVDEVVAMPSGFRFMR
jgi:hypothetical protein